MVSLTPKPNGECHERESRTLLEAHHDPATARKNIVSTFLPSTPRNNPSPTTINRNFHPCIGGRFSLFSALVPLGTLRNCSTRAVVVATILARKSPQQKVVPQQQAVPCPEQECPGQQIKNLVLAHCSVSWQCLARSFSGSSLAGRRTPSSLIISRDMCWSQGRSWYFAPTMEKAETLQRSLSSKVLKREDLPTFVQPTT